LTRSPLAMPKLPLLIVALTALSIVASLAGNPLDAPSGDSAKQPAGTWEPIGDVYRGDGLTLVLAVAEFETLRVRGSLELGGRKMPFEAKGGDETFTRFEGTFEADGERFAFTGRYDEEADVVVLQTGRTTYRLAWADSVEVDPGDFLPVAPAEPAVEQADEVRDDEARPAGTVTFVPVELFDQGTGIVSHTLLVPKGWTHEGGVRWQIQDQTAPNQFVFKVASPSGEEYNSWPALRFTYTRNRELRARMGVDVGQPVGDGSIFMPPPEDLKAFVVERLLPGARPGAQNVRVVEDKPAPEIRRQFIEGMGGQAALDRHERTMRQMGGEFRVDVLAGRVVVEYDQAGVRWSEVFDVVAHNLYSAQRMINGQLLDNNTWTSANPISVRARVGDEAVRPTLMTVAQSIRQTPRYTMAIMEMWRNINEIRRRGFQERMKIIAKSNEDLRRIHGEIYDNKTAAREKANRDFIDTITDIDRFTASDGTKLALPNHYEHYFRNERGEIVVSNDPNFDPRPGSTLTWEQLERDR
jgi:hypothetical protein